MTAESVQEGFKIWKEGMPTSPSGQHLGIKSYEPSSKRKPSSTEMENNTQPVSADRSRQL
eukprot:3134830-Ditylum_brightwellii.AAC.1